jgi:hypothetical protein
MSAPSSGKGAMFGSPEFFRRIPFLAAFLAVLFVATASAQQEQANTPKYDPHTEAKMKGIVEELKLPPKGSEKEAAHLLLKDGTDNVDVYLCPKSFLDDMGVSYSKGDEVALTDQAGRSRLRARPRSGETTDKAACKLEAYLDRLAVPLGLALDYAVSSKISCPISVTLHSSF